MSAAFIIALLVVFLVARSLVRPLRILRDGALRVAHTDLEQGIARVRAGDEREPEPLAVYTTEEIGQVAHAVDELHAQALLLAGDEARLRLVINEMFETMSRRNRSLVDQQLALIDRLEKSEDDPERLDNLFRLDHLATRMRRIGANLLVLAGAQVSRDHRESLPLASAVNAAVSEVEDYKRVEVGEVPDSALVGRISADAVHMLAELIDNALRYSPPISPVRVSAEHTSNAGLLIEVHDDGIGMTDSDLRIANMRLHAGGEVSQDNTRHMGLFVVGRLAHMHGMAVRLRNAVEGEPSSGTTAELYIPPKLLEHGAPIGRRRPALRRPLGDPRRGGPVRRAVRGSGRRRIRSRRAACRGARRAPAASPGHLRRTPNPSRSAALAVVRSRRGGRAGARAPHGHRAVLHVPCPRRRGARGEPRHQRHGCARRRDVGARARA